MSENSVPVEVKIASTAMARLKASLKDEELLKAHFTVGTVERFFQFAYEEGANALHEEMHEEHGTCHPEGDNEDAMPIEERLLRYMFLLGRAAEEFAVMELAEKGELRFQQ